jgi:DNA-binding response OmpR family regulator
MNIGLLEDNSTIVTLITTMLEMAGHHVFAYTEGRSLLETVFGAPVSYDVLIIDLGLPGELSGFDVIHAIKQTNPADGVPIIVVSGAGQHELMRVQTHHPEVSIVRKPFSMRSLLLLIEQRKKSSGGGPVC